ncbi:MAG: hypothetical protein L3J63_12275, partial [Geopsychrobacter sp.]|nr:hypothetical protein [Geopsychrobacter sp.]
SHGCDRLTRVSLRAGVLKFSGPSVLKSVVKVSNLESFNAVPAQCDRNKKEFLLPRFLCDSKKMMSAVGPKPDGLNV